MPWDWSFHTNFLVFMVQLPGVFLIPFNQWRYLGIVELFISQGLIIITAPWLWRLLTSSFPRRWNIEFQTVLHHQLLSPVRCTLSWPFLFVSQRIEVESVGFIKIVWVFVIGRNILCMHFLIVPARVVYIQAFALMTLARLRSLITYQGLI